LSAVYVLIPLNGVDFLVAGKGAVDFAEFMKMMAKNGPTTASEIKETFAIFNSSGRCASEPYYH
jgi:sugar phosphate isomerase/epimerase